MKPTFVSWESLQHLKAGIIKIITRVENFIQRNVGRDKLQHRVARNYCASKWSDFNRISFKMVEKERK